MSRPPEEEGPEQGDALAPVLARYRVATGDADERIAHRSIRAKLFGTTEEKTYIGKYALEQMIGVGGMGRVYLAHDTELDRRVAIKLLKGAEWAGAGLEEGRLWREARTLAQISHRNVVAVYEVGEHPDLGVYVVMEHIAGATMQTWIDQRSPKPAEVYDVLRAAGSGLAAAHRAGIVHRDFKPGNVLIGADGRVCVADFGLSHDIALGPPALAGTPPSPLQPTPAQRLTSGPAGTPAYMAPERLAGNEARIAGDIYSYCLTAWEALTGQLSPPQTTTPLDPRRVIPRPLKQVLLRGLDPDPDRRWETIRPVLRALRHAQKRRKRNRSIAVTAGLVAAAVATGIGVRSGTPQRQAEPAATLSSLQAPAQRAAQPAVAGVLAANLGPGSPRDALGFARAARIDLAWSELDGASATAWPDNVFRFAPNAKGVDLDHLYAALDRHGIDVVPVLIGTPTWFGGVTPRPQDLAADDPAAYRAHAEMMFQIVARYGGTRIETARLRTAPEQARLRGLGLITAVESWPQPDAAHGDSLQTFSPAEYAAMASADRDGHQGALGPNVGIHAADPRVQLVMGGLGGTSTGGDGWADSITEYLDEMRAWADLNRAGSFPVDVVSIRVFPPRAEPTAGPEEARLEAKVAQIVEYRDHHLPGHPVWVSAFGYDSQPASPRSAGKDHAQWTARSYLAMIAGGADRAFIADLADHDGSSAAGATSGLLGPSPHFEKKSAWYAVASLKHLLGEYRFARRVAVEQDGAHVLEFASANERAFVVWTEAPPAVDHPKLALATGGKHVELATLAIDGEPAPRTTTAVRDGVVELSLGEMPVVVFVR